MVIVCSTVADHLIVQMSCHIRGKILWIVYYTKKGAWIYFAGFVKGQSCGSTTFLGDSRDMSKYRRLNTWKLSNHMEPNSWTKLFPKHTRYSCRHIWTSNFHSAALANWPNTIWLRWHAVSQHQVFSFPEGWTYMCGHRCEVFDNWVYENLPISKVHEAPWFAIISESQWGYICNGKAKRI